MNIKVLLFVGFGSLTLACKGDTAVPSQDKDFQPPPRTAANTWIASADEEALIRVFLSKYPPARAARYRETLLRTDARLELPNDPAGQKMLDAIYAARRLSQEGEISPTTRNRK